VAAAKGAVVVYGSLVRKDLVFRVERYRFTDLGFGF